MNFFDALIEWVELAGTFLMNMIESLINAATLVVTSLSFSTVVVSYMPPLIGAGATIAIAFGVIKFLAGR